MTEMFIGAYPSKLKISYSEGGSDHYSINFVPEARERFVYTLPPGVEICGLECAQYDRPAGSKNRSIPTIPSITFLTWNPSSIYMPHSTKGEKAQITRDIELAYDY